MEDKTKQALYRRYRSTSFDELVGQEHVTDLLKTAVEKGTISHAYLFTGQRGTGKTSAARILAHAINELPYDANSTHLDIIEIDAASNRRIDDIRDLREKVHIAPVSAKYKVYIIDEVHMLTGESFNALLKTIEEPPEHAIFILATTELHKVPATIVSRTQRFHFRPVSYAKVVNHLKNIAEKEGIDIDDESLKLIAEHGGGSFRDSISMLDQLGNIGEKITLEQVENILGRARSADIQQIAGLLSAGDTKNLHVLLDDIHANGTSPVTLSEQLVGHILKSPENSRPWYELTEKLMTIPKSTFPGLSLMSTLLGFAARNTTETSSPKTEKSMTEKKVVKNEAKPTPVKPSNEAAEVVSKAKLDEVKSDTKQTEEPDAVEPSTPKGDGEFDWNKILEATQKTNPALFSILGRAETSFENNTLTLRFKYALHRKKLDQAQYRTQLSRAIQDVCGINPDIVVDDLTNHLAADDSIKKVADLMGGGEVVSV